MLQVHVVACLKDNYAYLIEDKATKHAWVVDPSESTPVQAALKQRGLTLTLILNTHHHWDHVGGNIPLKAEYHAPIVCSIYDEPRITGADIAVRDEQRLHFGDSPVRIIEIPGHTLGHVAYYFEKEQFLFSGDTLFSGGCGRLFEGTPAQMFESLQKLARLPETTRVYCGHEYTEANMNFARMVEPTNQELISYSEEVRANRARGQPSIPSAIGLEKTVNLFIRAQTVEQFAALRTLKDKL